MACVFYLNYMRTILLTLMLVTGFCISVQAQERDRNFIQIGLTETACYSNQERGLNLSQNPTKDFRNSMGISLSIGRWVSRKVGLRLKFYGLDYKTVVSDNREENKSRYMAAFGDVMLNASSFLFGESKTRRWEVSPFLGGGINRNFSYDEYGIGLRFGLLNNWRLYKRLSLQLELAYSVYEPDTDGKDPYENVVSGGSRHSLKNRDRSIIMELGLNYRFGK